jgi:adenylate cyclase
MILKDHLRVWIGLTIRQLRYHFLFWNAAFFFYLFLTSHKAFFTHYLGFVPEASANLNVVLLSSIVTVFFTLLDTVITDYGSHRLLRGIKTLMLVLAGFLIVMLPAAMPYLHGDESFKMSDLVEQLPKMNQTMLRFLMYFYLACVLNRIFKAIISRVGKSHLLNWLLGRLNKPREQNRIFMFVDMKASTTIAEKLGHKLFSGLVQDVFNDMAVVNNYHGEIYQYLGDGAIVSWSRSKGLRKNNCLEAFFAFRRVVENRARYYDRKYGLVPEFKAGLHIGPVMVLQVGRVRRDISYNGDTINTAARIESMSGEYEKDLLISGVLYESLKDWSKYRFSEVGNIKLKGKRRNVLLYSVEP